MLTQSTIGDSGVGDPRGSVHESPTNQAQFNLIWPQSTIRDSGIGDSGVGDSSSTPWCTTRIPNAWIPNTVYHTYDHYHEWPPSPITTIQSVHMHNSTWNGNRSHWSYMQWIDLWPLHDWPLCMMRSRGLRGLRKISLRQKKLKQTLSYHALYVSYVSKRICFYNIL